MDKRKKKTILIYLLVLVVLYVVIYVIPSVTGAMVRTYTVEYGNLRVYDETQGYFVRDEAVYLATSSGRENLYIDHNTLVKKGTSILEISGSNEDGIASKYNKILERLGGDVIKNPSYISQDEGVVSYYADGYEAQFTPKNMKNFSYEEISGIKDDEVVNLERKLVVRGEPVFKIVSNAKWYLLCYVDASKVDNYVVGRDVLMGFEDGDISGWIYSVKKQGSKLQVIVKTNNFYEKYDRHRVLDVKLITSDKNGLIIENESIVTEDKQQGVYVKNKYKRYSFVPISILGTDGKNSVIEKSYYYDDNGVVVETVNTYDEILKSPKDEELIKIEEHEE